MRRSSPNKGIRESENETGSIPCLKLTLHLKKWGKMEVGILFGQKLAERCELFVSFRECIRPQFIGYTPEYIGRGAIMKTYPSKLGGDYFVINSLSGTKNRERRKQTDFAK